MTEKESALYSQYIIDGVKHDMTPAELLNECMENEDDNIPDTDEFNDIIDESTEPPLSSFCYEQEKVDDYIALMKERSSEERDFRMLYPEHFSRLTIAGALLSRLWSKGHFRLGDLRLWAQWEWNSRPLGNMASFYTSISSSSEYIYSLGIRIEDYAFIESDETSNVKFFAWLPEDIKDKSEEDETEYNILSPYQSRHPWINEQRECPAQLVYDPESWIIYMPFDTCSFKLGDSLLAQLFDSNGGKAPVIDDPDYFIDCFEVVRELVEDGIIMSGAVVIDGGLGGAISRFCGENGAKIDLSGLMASYNIDNDIIKIMFGEVPGILIQVSDDNYDYVDSQFLLQDVAYYPLGHPDSSGKIEFIRSDRSNVADILSSLLNQASEGED